MKYQDTLFQAALNARFYLLNFLCELGNQLRFFDLMNWLQERTE